MLAVLFHPSKSSKIVILLLILYGWSSTCGQLSLTQGQDAELTFPYPCDSTEVTLQHRNRAPFYHLTLPQDQGERLRVENRISNGNCSLDLTIGGVMRNDGGTYISSVYKDGEKLIDKTHRIHLNIQHGEYPPGKASCVEVEGRGRGGDWVLVECTAEVGSLSGKIECYQNGEMMPYLTDPIETQNILMQSIIVRKLQPTFCCSCTLNENKGRCECNDTALYLSNDSIRDPCPSSSTIPTLRLTPESTEINTTVYFSTIISNIPTKINKGNCKSVIVHSILVPIEIILLVSMIVTLCVFYKLKIKAQNIKLKIKTQSNHNHYDLNKNNMLLLGINSRGRMNGLNRENTYSI